MIIPDDDRYDDRYDDRWRRDWVSISDPKAYRGAWWLDDRIGL